MWTLRCRLAASEAEGNEEGAEAEAGNSTAVLVAFEIDILRRASVAANDNDCAEPASSPTACDDNEENDEEDVAVGSCAGWCCSEWC